MKNKIMGILVVTLFIFTSTLPLVIGNQKEVCLNTDEEFGLCSISDGEKRYIVINDDYTNDIEKIKYTGENLVPNPSFEEGEGDLPTGWNHDTVMNSEIYHWDNTNFHSGEKSIGVSKISQNGWYDWSTTDLIAVDLVNMKYIISVYYTYSDLPNEGQKAGIWLELYNENREDLLIAFGNFLEYSNQWTCGGTHSAWIPDEYAIITSYVKIRIDHLSFWGSPDPNPEVEIRFDDVYFGVIENDPPLKPNTPTGPSSGKKLNNYTYSTNAIDPDDDQLYYFWDWGDNTTDLCGPYNSGENCQCTHMYQENGTYEIRVKARDEKFQGSEWSDPLSVSMPKNKPINTPIIKFLENHPYLFPLLRQLFGL